MRKNNNFTQKSLRGKLRALDITPSICNHLIGKEHTNLHKIISGVVIMVLGVAVSMISKQYESVIIHFFGDGLGYLIHGLGAVPIINSFLKL